MAKNLKRKLLFSGAIINYRGRVGRDLVSGEPHAGRKMRRYVSGRGIRRRGRRGRIEDCN